MTTKAYVVQHYVVAPDNIRCGHWLMDSMWPVTLLRIRKKKHIGAEVLHPIAKSTAQMKYQWKTTQDAASCMHFVQCAVARSPVDRVHKAAICNTYSRHHYALVTSCCSNFG